VYWQVLPSGQLGLWLCVVSQATPQPPQLVAVLVFVSQPSVFGAEGLQSAKPGMHPVYWHMGAPPGPVTHDAPMLLAVSQTRPHAPHDDVDVIDVSHPFVFAPD
jgi:hypothetical protein